MKRTLIALIAASALMGTHYAQAQSCTDELGQNLLDCIDGAVTSCAEAIPECNQFDAALTLEDVREIAVNLCCSKAARAARRVCLNKERRKYSPSVRTGEQRAFFAAARNEINDLRTTDCNSNGYQDGI